MLYMNNRETGEYFSDGKCVENFNVLSQQLFLANCHMYNTIPNLLMFTHFLEAIYLYLLGNTSWKAGRKKYAYADIKNGVHRKSENHNAPERTVYSVVGEDETSPELDEYVNSHSSAMQAALESVYAVYCKQRQAVSNNIPDLTIYYRVLMAQILNLLPMRTLKVPYDVRLIQGLILFCFYNGPLSCLSVKEADQFWTEDNYSYLPLASVNRIY